MQYLRSILIALGLLSMQGHALTEPVWLAGAGPMHVSMPAAESMSMESMDDCCPAGQQDGQPCDKSGHGDSCSNCPSGQCGQGSSVFLIQMASLDLVLSLVQRVTVPSAPRVLAKPPDTLLRPPRLV